MIILCCYFIQASETEPYSIERFFDLLQMSRIEITNRLMKIEHQWEIKKYPKFLKSCQMQNSSWFALKLKFMHAIVAAEMFKYSINANDTIKLTNEFKVSFTGSSVTAGHDNLISNAYPSVVNYLMINEFAFLNIALKVRNGAQGNSLCFPYDPCVKTIAGEDADIVMWEHTNKCLDLSMYEQFARQLLLTNSKPILVYSESQTSHWYACVYSCM